MLWPILLLLTILGFLFVLFRLFRNNKKHEENASSEDDIVVRPLQRRGGRSSLLRRHNTTEQRETEERDEEEESSSTTNVTGRKLKKKKQAHKEAERERKQALVAARQAQKEKLERERQREEEERKERERWKEERLAELERVRREKEQLEAKEYEKWKSSIQLTEQGEEERELEEEREDLLPQFISYIIDKKMVVLEQLALEMNMNTEDVIQRIQLLQQQGHLTGVFDDRGKFIYISLEEMEAVANFIKTRGRISIKELSRRCTDWIQLPDDGA